MQSALAEQYATLLKQHATLLQENRLLQQKVHFLMQRLFGRTSEKLDRRQLELLLGELQALTAPPPEDDPPPSPPGPRRAPRDAKPRLPENLPTEEIIVDPEEVTRDPTAYRLIGTEVTEELDVIPVQYLRRLIIRRKFMAKADHNRPPILAPLAPRLIEGSYASAGLLTDIVLKKYVDHLPLYRHPEAGDRSAIIYTLLECCKRRGINPQEYLRDVLTRLPTLTNHQTRELTPGNWLAARRAKAA